MEDIRWYRNDIMRGLDITLASHHDTFRDSFQSPSVSWAPSVKIITWQWNRKLNINHVLLIKYKNWKGIWVMVGAWIKEMFQHFYNLISVSCIWGFSVISTEEFQYSYWEKTAVDIKATSNRNLKAVLWALNKHFCETKQTFLGNIFMNSSMKCILKLKL